MNKLDQKILCIESKILFEKGKWNGLKTDNLDDIYQLLLEKSEFRRRGDLEKDINYKQIIPQVVLKFQNKYFLHKQVDGEETRLNSLWPLPLGGHVEEFDFGKDKDLIQVALERELHEEVEFEANILSREFLGLLYVEDANPVNHVHIGLCYLFEIDSDDVFIKEEGLETIGFVTKEFLKENIDKLTYWSKYLIKQV